MGVFFALVLLVIYGFQHGSCKVCQTQVCKETATRVQNAMNENVNPCDDFYEFACRGWIEKNPIQNGFAWDPTWAIRSDVEGQINRILTATDEKAEGRPIKLARAMYRNCMDWKAIDNVGLRPINDTLYNLGLPQKPPTDREAETLDISRIVGRAKRFYGKDIFLDMRIDQDWRDSTKNRLMIEQPTMAMWNLERNLQDPERYANDLNLQKLYIHKIIKLAGAEEKLNEYTTELVNFMTEITQIMVNPNSRILANDMIRDRTISKVQRQTDRSASHWNWMSYLNGIFERTDVIVDYNKDVVGLTDTSYFKELPKVLARSSRGTIARYVWWEIWSWLAPQTKETLRQLGMQRLKKVYGPPTGLQRWQACTRFVNDYFDLAITAAYVNKHFNVSARKKAMEMWTDVSSAFDDMLIENHWMDADTKAQARKKLHAMKPFIGFPDWITNPSRLETYYRDFRVFDGRLFDTYISLDSSARRAQLNGWRQAPDKTKWVTPGTTVNAIYNRIMNSVTFPAGYLHIPFYDNGVEAINYGAIGAVMGHELTHGFDNLGHRFDEKGNVRNWWSADTLRHYWEKVSCIVKQYSAYVVAQLGGNFRVNGQLTKSENIADNGGVREAYRAYKKLKARTGPQPVLSSLERYTDEQLFFLGYAQMYCGSYTDRELKAFLEVDPHTPNRWRVIGTLQNNEDFARVWNCPRGSPMTSTSACTVW